MGSVEGKARIAQSKYGKRNLMALSALDKLKKRRKFPVTIGDETVFISAMSKSDIKRLADVNSVPTLTKGPDESDEAFAERVAAEEKNHASPDEFILGLVLLDDAGNPAFTPNEGESDRDFAERVAAETVDVPHITKKEIYAAVRRVSGYIVEELEKN